MDTFIKKRLGIFLLIAIGGLALPLGELIVSSPIPIMWKWYIGTILTAGLVLGEEYVRHQFKVSKEEAPKKPLPTTPSSPVLPPQ